LSLPLIRDEKLRRSLDVNEQRLADFLQQGCYLLKLSLKNNATLGTGHLLGVMRVERIAADQDSITFKITSDLYIDQGQVFVPDTVPTFTRSDYVAYLTLAQNALRFADGGLRIKFNVGILDQSNGEWSSGPKLRLVLTNATSSAHEAIKYAIQVSDGSTDLGNGTATWQCMDFRSIALRTAATQNATIPMNNGGVIGWAEVFRQVGWRLNLAAPLSISHPTGGNTWSPAVLHKVLTTCIPVKPTLDEEWHVFLLCVEDIVYSSDAYRGMMFDFAEFDSDKTPRQGCAISATWPIPSDASWHPASTQKVFGKYPPLYFRTAVHELGHSFGLEHPSTPGPEKLMSATNDLVGKTGFPDKLPFEFSKEEQEWLTHMPDPVVRPGGLPYPTSNPSDDRPPRELRNSICEIKLDPLLPSYPMGAPVRICFVITNRSRKTLRLPRNVGFSHGGVNVRVVGPDGKAKLVTPNLLVCDECDWVSLGSRKSVWGAITLLRCRQGALFSEVGTYRIELVIPARLDRENFTLRGRGKVSVKLPPTKSSQKLANRAINAKELQPTLVLGGELSTNSSRLLNSLLDDKVFGPHYKFLEAKRIASTWVGRGDLRKIVSLISNDSVMTFKEISRALNIIQSSLENKSRAFVAAQVILEQLREKIVTENITLPVKSELMQSYNLVVRLLKRKQSFSKGLRRIP
jgi:hypothetical protein